MSKLRPRAKLARRDWNAAAFDVERHLTRLYTEVDHVVALGISFGTDDAFLVRPNLLYPIEVVQMSVSGLDLGTSAGKSLVFQLKKSTDGGSSYTIVGQSSVTSDTTAGTKTDVDTLTDTTFAAGDWLLIDIEQPTGTPFVAGSAVIEYRTFVEFGG